ncbi:hypothetical protein JHS3_22640 [Jeongeupia sp. HS-3]|nr:hypothetical protein JHS3_22640 [Jeongeupia sp. HS-3]
MVLLEASAHGLPMVAFDCDTGPSEIIQHRRNGWLCPPEDVVALATALCDAIEMANDDERYLFHQNEALKGVEKFDLDVVLIKWVHLLGLN